jgi:trimeric autotransporter adhesin
MSAGRLSAAWKALAAALAVCGGLAVSSGTAAGQRFEGGIRGRVTDATGVVAGANVQIVEEGTRLTHTTVSNGDGEYAFPNVLPGT